GDAVGHRDGGDRHGDALDQEWQFRIADVHQVQVSARSDGGDLEQRIDGEVGGLARQLDLAEQERLLEIADVDDCQAGGARGHIGGLAGGGGGRADHLDVLGGTVQREGGDHPGGQGGASQGAGVVDEDVGEVVDAVAGGERLVGVGADGELDV